MLHNVASICISCEHLQMKKETAAQFALCAHDLNQQKKLSFTGVIGHK